MSPERKNLALRQQALVTSILSLEQPQNNNPLLRIFSHNTNGHDLTERLGIYQNNLKATANRALSIAYPVLEKLIGESSMRLLSQRLLKTEYFHTGDWGDWGESLASLVETSELADDFPFLSEVARLEWKRHQASRTSENGFDRDTLTLLEGNDLNSLYIQLPRSLELLTSEFPVDTLWDAHQDYNDQLEARKTLKHELETVGNEYHFIIYNNGFHAIHERISQQEFLWLSSILAGHNLHELLTLLPIFDFSSWLKKAIENQYITGFNNTQHSD